MLELFLAQNEVAEARHVRRVLVEMNMDEARAFVAKLRDIEREVISAGV